MLQVQVCLLCISVRVHPYPPEVLHMSPWAFIVVQNPLLYTMYLTQLHQTVVTRGFSLIREGGLIQYPIHRLSLALYSSPIKIFKSVCCTRLDYIIMAYLK